MTPLRTVERLLGVLMAAVWLFVVLATLYRNNPKVKTYIATARYQWHRAVWALAYEQLPPWLQEAADVRGYKPGDTKRPIPATAGKCEDCD